MDFPVYLDNAAVLEFSDRGDFGTIRGDETRVRHLAICQYPGGTEYYLFFCAGQEDGYEVLMDDLCESVADCKRSASRFKDMVWNKR